ncbi:MAG TPA: GGDEF domain-containing protein [Solirubrobacterales bacterium]|nr:GGDEF domain-containing protein [Solirubrobacterales bacterium]
MGSTRGLRALEVTEERELAGRVAGLLYLIGAVTVSLLLLVPGTETSHWPVVLALSATAAAWGLVCLLVIPWRRVHPLISHLSSAGGLPLTAVAMAATGGAESPARFYLLFIVVYASYFYPPREAIPHVVGCVLVLLLPLLYDSNAVDGGLLGETLVLTPTFFILGGLIMGGKQIMVELARHDALTGLVNRRVFEQRLHESLRGRRSSDDGFGLIFCDLDSFKEVNTKYGHPEGDRVLCEVAVALTGAVRDGDLVARLGGDEFAIVAAGADDAGMEKLAHRMGARLEEANGRLGLTDFELRASFGWALFPRDADSPERLVAKADLALRQAKEQADPQASLSRLQAVGELAQT